jgi:hypothetical protein
VAQRIADHADSRTTELYDRRGQKVLIEDMERNAELGISPNVEYGKMRSELNEGALGVDLRGIRSAFCVEPHHVALCTGTKVPGRIPFFVKNPLQT